MQLRFREARKAIDMELFRIIAKEPRHNYYSVGWKEFWGNPGDHYCEQPL